MRLGAMFGFMIFAGFGCEGGHALFVDLVTDFEPGVEFTAVRTEVLHNNGGGVTTTVARFGDEYLGGIRIAEFDRIGQGPVTTRVFLVGPDGTDVIRRNTIIDLAGDTGFTVLATRSCIDIRCPGTGEPSATECVGGHCVDPQCTVESPEFCGPPGCTLNSDCGPASLPCAQEVCVATACLVEGLDALCAADEYCDVSTGCAPRPVSPTDGSVDGSLDGGVDADADADAAGDAASDATLDAALDAALDAPMDSGVDAGPPTEASFILTAGPTIADAPGIYTRTTDVHPGARRFPMYFTGSSGNMLYLFGGRGFDASGTRGQLNDLWRFDIAASQWVFLGGESTANAPGDWGTLGVAAPSNQPSGRYNAVMVTDSLGNAWLYGGSGIDSTGASGLLADLWRYELASGTWTWMAGPNTINAVAVFGTEGMPAPGNRPGQRVDYGLFTDAANNIWLFGGKEQGIFAWRNDLWRFRPATGLWTWFGGYTDAASYGTQGTPAGSNIPGARHILAWAQDGTSSFYVFGGEGRDITGAEWVLGDLWRYQPATDLWTWVSGPTTEGEEPVFGTLGVPDDTSRPGGRFTGRIAVDGTGRVWVHGGWGRISGGDNALSDLWVYDPPTDRWTWIAGGNVGNEITVLGAGGGPGSREGQGLWFDDSGTLFIFGGIGWDPTGTRGDLADLWRLTPP